MDCAVSGVIKRGDFFAKISPPNIPPCSATFCACSAVVKPQTLFSPKINVRHAKSTSGCAITELPTRNPSTAGASSLICALVYIPDSEMTNVPSGI